MSARCHKPQITLKVGDFRFTSDCVAKLVSDLGASLALEFRRFFWYGVSAVSI
ncbi:hypothetical protein ABIB90_004356, partial [Bradyrhizobium sp. JR4.1]